MFLLYIVIRQDMIQKVTRFKRKISLTVLENT